MKTVRATCFWRSVHTLEVPDDFDGDLMELDFDVLMEVDSHTAELYDWEVST